MKTFLSITFTLLLSLIYYITAAQTPWDINGNSGIAPATDFVGTIGSESLRFRTDNTFRMGLTGADGFLGINTTNPASRFHMVDGAFVVSGNTSANPNLGQGERMMWIPERWAFRAGQVTGTNWDAPNVGFGSFSFGDNLVSGNNSGASGSGNTITGTGPNAYAFGQNNIISGSLSYSFGALNNISGSNSGAFGYGIEILGFNSFAAGRLITIEDDISMGIGCFIESTEPGNITLGSGTSSINLLNDIENCLMVGFNSDIPTFYVGPSLGPGKTGNVGVGTTAPVAKFHVESETGEDTGINVTVVHNDQNITGIMSDASGGQFGYGGQFRGTGSTASYGVLATGTTGSDRGYGVVATGNGTSRGVGVWGSSSEGEISVGVAGISTGDSLSIGVYGEGGDYAAYFAGDVVENMTPLNLSDEKFKMNVEEINCGLECLAQLNPVSYDFKTEEFPHMHFSDGRQYGLIAQEVNEVLPDIVHTVKKPEMIDPESGEVISAGEENLAIQYGALIPILISSVQEQ